jgi:putative membrane protein
MRPSNGFGPMMNHQIILNGHQHSGHPFGWVLLFILLALVVALVVWIVLRVRGEGTAVRQVVAAPVDDAVDVVRMRYAKGEIDRREFLKVIADLGAPPEPPPPATA